MDKTGFNERLRQILILLLILAIALLLIIEMKVFIPGLLGGVTLYILSRSVYFQLIYKRNSLGHTFIQFCI